MKRLSVLSALVLASAFFMSACGGGGGGSGGGGGVAVGGGGEAPQGQILSLKESQRYFPLNDGSLWVSRRVESIDGIVTATYTNVSRIAGTKVVGNVNALVMADNDIGSSTANETYLVNDDSGVTIYGVNDTSDTLTAAVVPYKLVNFPLQIGSSFQQFNKNGVDYGEDLDGDGRYEKIDINEIVVVRGLEAVSTAIGSFPNCLRIETQLKETLTFSSDGSHLSASSVETTWYAQDVGPVKQSTKITGDFLRIQTIEDEITGCMLNGYSNGLQMQVNASNAIINNGETFQLSVTLLDSSNSLMTTVPATWSSSNRAIASVGSDGMVTGNGMGVVILTPSIGGVAGPPVTITVLVGFKQGVEYPGPSSNYGFSDTAIGDLNGDGRNDVAVIERMSTRIMIYLQNATGGLNQPFVINTQLFLNNNNSDLSGIALKDINNDGAVDLVVSGISTTATSGWLGRVAVYKQNPITHSLGPPQEYVLSTNSPGPLAIADLNGDGLQDFVVASPIHAGVGVLSFVYQGGDGSFGPEIAYPTVLADYNEVHVADLNGDGLNDVVVQSGTDQLAVIKQLTPGLFSTAPDYYTIQNALYIRSVALGDLNGDGRTDIAVADAYDQMTIFLQNAAGTLSPSFLGYSQASELKIFDIDGDGLNDIILLNNGYIVKTLTQSADHTFPNTQAFVLHTHGSGGTIIRQAMSLGDVTGDGLPDIVASWGTGIFVLERR